MDINQVIARYADSPQTKQLIETLSTEGDRSVQLKGVVGSAFSFIATAVFQKQPSVYFFILNDKDDAAYFLNDLENLLGNDKVMFFPQSYRKPYEIENTDNANVVLRAEVLSRIEKSSGPLAVVTYAAAITEKVVTRKLLAKNTLELKVGERISVEFITDLLYEYGFERVDYVTQPGQYSVRGGIIDVFSFANENPYRIELFGNDVESLRTFDTGTQLSVAQHKKIILLPNVEGKLLKESRESLLDFLPKNTLFWVKDINYCGDRLTKEFEIAEQAYVKIQSALNHLEPTELFISDQEFYAFIRSKPVVFLANTTKIKPSAVIEYNQSPQPAFSKNFDLLIANLKENLARGIRNILFADTGKQVERIYSILEDLKTSKGINFSTEDVTPIFLSIQEGFIDKDLNLACYTDHQIFERYHKYKVKSFNKSKEALTLKELHNLNPGDFVTHIDHGVGKFAGLEKIEVNGKTQEAIRLVYKDNDILYVSIHSLHRIAKFSGQEGHAPKINKLGSNAWGNLKQKTKSKVKEIAFDLIKLYAKRRTHKGFEFAPDSYLQNELEASFIYEDTPDQEKATAAVKKDMENAYPMDRLVCGDVGFGKTEIAVRAAFKAATDGKQVAILVPTTILALQHYKTFSERLKDFPVRVDYINRFKTSKQQKDTIKNIADGKVDILIGTHRLVGKDIKFKDLGLLIIDEEQKFGVSVKEKLKALKSNIDTLTLTATPIPRTLQFSMMGARDLSVIATPPPNRYPVQTEVHTFNEEVIRDAISYEIDRGGQVFFIHNRVQNIKDVAGMIQRLVPDAKVLTGHGQMEGDKLEEVMLSFINGDYDVLVATTIIESGLDIPNANTIIINSAHMFGLSDLHQMRGRVGRSNKKAFCYLLAPPISTLTNEARKRLKAIEEFADLGSGFNIAMRDLDIRGAGNLLGAEQSGFISEIGFEMYIKILDEAMEELKESEFKDLFLETANQSIDIRKKAQEQTFVRDCQIDTDLEILIPDEYVSNITERLALYKQLDDIENADDLKKFEANLIDRFGPVPDPVKELMDTIVLRSLAKKCGFEKLVLKNKKLVGFFISNQESLFYQSPVFTQILQYVQTHPIMCKMKEAKGKLTLSFEDVSNIEEAVLLLKAMLQ